jgi:hypothetical protein
MNVLFTPSSPSVLSACWEQLETLLGDGAAVVDFRVLPDKSNDRKPWPRQEFVQSAAELAKPSLASLAPKVRA